MKITSKKLVKSNEETSKVKHVQNETDLDEVADDLIKKLSEKLVEQKNLKRKYISSVKETEKPENSKKKHRSQSVESNLKNVEKFKKKKNIDTITKVNEVTESKETPRKPHDTLLTTKADKVEESKEKAKKRKSAHHITSNVEEVEENVGKSKKKKNTYLTTGVNEIEGSTEKPETEEKQVNKTNTRPEKKKTHAQRMSEDEKQRTIFVGNLPTSVTRRDIVKVFKEAGEIDTVRLRSIVPSKVKLSKKVASIKKEIAADSKDNINAYVKYKNSEGALAALKMNGTMFGGHRLQVDKCFGDKCNNKYSIFVGSLKYDAKEDALHKYFAECGEIDKVRIVRDSETGLCRGFAFILFKDISSVELAMKLNGEKFDNRVIRITRVVKRIKNATGNDGKSRTGKFKKKAKKSKSKSESKSFMK